MGDRTTVTITIHANFLPKLIQLGGGTIEDLEEKVQWINLREFENNTYEFLGHEIKYGDWDELEDLLKKGNIEYNKHWEGGDYEAGKECYRYKNKKWQIIQDTSSEDKETILLLESLLKSKDITKAIQNKIKLLSNNITPLSDGKSNAEKFMEKI